LPDSCEGFAKLAGELQCIGFTALYGLETVRLRYAHVFGPRQCPTSQYAQPVPVIAKSMLAGQAPVLDAAFASLDLIHVDDVVHATLLAAEAPRVSGEVYNIASGRSVGLATIVATINQIRGARIEPIFQTRDRQSPPAKSFAIARAEMDLGFCPGIDLRQGLQGLMDHYGRQAIRPETEPAPERNGPHFSTHGAAALGSPHRHSEKSNRLPNSDQD